MPICFRGPRGVGKTTTARILAKGLNCVQGPTIEPCNECPSCKEIAAGQSMDVLEIDAASNTGVDNIRELRESARYAPSRDRYKIFIIDEVHMLSTSAFNALLKILEEPPPHVVFIMATTERHKLPATILSRCQQFVFRTISPAEIQAHLRQIVEREGVTIDDRALATSSRPPKAACATRSRCWIRLFRSAEQDVDSEDVRDVLGFIPSEILDRTIDCTCGGQFAGTARNCRDRRRSGAEHAAVRARIHRPDARPAHDETGPCETRCWAATKKRAALARRAEAFSEQDLIRYFDMLLRLENDFRWTSQPRFHLEVGLVKLARSAHMRDIEDVLRDLKQGAPSGPPSDVPQPASGAPRPRPAPPAQTSATAEKLHALGIRPCADRGEAGTAAPLLTQRRQPRAKSAYGAAHSREQRPRYCRARPGRADDSASRAPQGMSRS